MPKEVIVFTSPTCAPCKVLKPEMEVQQSLLGFPMRVVEMSFENSEEFKKYGVRAVPTVVCHDGEAEIGRFAGAQTPTAIGATLKEWGL